jgi:serine/threonine protein kinase
MTFEKGDTVAEEITKESTMLERKRTRGRRDLLMSSEFVESAVDRIMTCFDVGDSGQIMYAEFQQVVDSNPKIIQTFERCFHKEMWSVAEIKEGKRACCSSCFSAAPPSILPSLPTVPDDTPMSSISKSGWTYKRLKGASVFDKIYLIQRGNILYEYSNPSQALPEALIFLEGCYIDPASDVAIKRAYGLSISHQHEKFQETVLFFSNKRTRDDWITALRTHVSARGFDQFFHLQYKIGMGKFSEVFTALEKDTGEIYAVKVIDKRILNELERELMRSELAILKLINHPNVVKLIDIFDERHKTYVVMDLVQGGELFEYLRKQRVGEGFAQHVIKEILETVKYLHQFGIIHRDIKPENILMSDHGSAPGVVLTDFGLSKLVGPGDKVQVPCGTLSYVAPEVLNMAGYNREVDIWSVGVVGFLMISGTLPFINKDKRALMDMIKEGKVTFEGNIWTSVSAECLDFHKNMLQKDVNMRLTAESALTHPWILKDPLTFPLSPIAEQFSSKSPSEIASLPAQNHSDRVVSRPEMMSMVLDERGQVEGTVEVRLQTSKQQ